MAKKLRVVVAAGGTAGHVNPAIALAEELTKRGHEVQFVGTPKGLEATLVPQAGYSFKPVNVTGYDRAKPITLLSAGLNMLKAQRELTREFSAKSIDLAVGFGAYVSVACLRAARSVGVPYVIHEQNSVAGLANKMLAKQAASIAVTYPITAEFFSRMRDAKDSSVVITGNPVRAQIAAARREEGREFFDIPSDKKLLLIFGGSLGARHLNQAAARMKDALLSREDLIVLHATGNSMYDEALAELQLQNSEEKRWRVMRYIEKMGEALAASDLVISRAGASSIAEIEAVGAPSILIPYPYATGDHQRLNAESLVEVGAAYMIPDSALDHDELETLVCHLLDHQHEREELRAALQTRGGHLAGKRLADLVEKHALS